MSAEIDLVVCSSCSMSKIRDNSSVPDDYVCKKCVQLQILAERIERLELRVDSFWSTRDAEQVVNSTFSEFTSEEEAYKITEELARCTDLQLRQVTESFQEELKSEIESVVVDISETLCSTYGMSAINLEEIRRLTKCNQVDASQLLMKSILHGNIQNCRMFWNILSRPHVNLQNLLKCFKQDAKEEGILQHRYNLQVQSRNMKMHPSRLISDIYLNPTITMTVSQNEDGGGGSNNYNREIKMHELLKRRCSDTDKTNISVVYGAAGTGKSTLIQKIIHDWAKEMIYEEFGYVLHFQVQNLNSIKGRISLRGLIVDTYPDLENYLGDLWKNPKRLLFIFDDLNHLDPSVSFCDDERNSDQRHRCTGPESICYVQDILCCLLQGKLLRGCSVLITARLWEQEKLRHVAADSTFQVMDFTPENIKEFFSRYLRHGQYLNELAQLIVENDILRNMSGNPLFCYALASSLEFHQPQREENITMPVIFHSQLLLDYVALLNRECRYDIKTNLKYLLEVGELAFKGLTRNTLSFEAGTLSELKYCPPNFASAFMIQDPGKQNRGPVYEFRYSVVRDFLAALAKILNTPIAQLKGLLDAQFTDTVGRFRIFSLFLVGLSSQKSIDCLKLQLGSVPSEVTSCISEWFTKSVKRRLANMDGKSVQNMFLHILQCLLEFGDNIITKEVLAPIRKIKIHQLLTSSDCTVLSRSLIHSEVIEELDLSSSLPQPEEIQKLGPMLQRCAILRLNQNNLQHSGVKIIFKMLGENDCKIQTLELKSNRLTDDCLEDIFSALCTNCSLTLLNLSNLSKEGQHGNQFTHDGLQRRVNNCRLQREIRWLRYEDTGLDTTSNVFTLITE